jgi:arylsulfatase A-like enzyme
MTRRWTTLLFCASLLFVSSSVAWAKPNVLFLFADDMRADSIAALGNPTIKTPHLDTLVRRGFSFQNAYCLGGNSPAVCTPSRNMLQSGNAYFRWSDYTSPGGKQGMLAPADGPNLARSMREAGYLTYHHGKRSNTATLIQATYEVNKYLTNDEAERRCGEPGKEIVDAAIDFVVEKHDRPWFMYLAFGNPHDPRIANSEYMQQYDEASIPLPKNYLPVHPFDDGEMAVRDERLLPWPRTEADVRRTLHEYYATITALDHHIGRLLAELQKQGQLDNTIVVFSADQGIAVGSHGLLGKQSLYDAAMKVPLFFAGPGIAQGKSDVLVYLLDTAPTLVDLAGGSPMAGVDGRSFRSVLEGKTSTARQELFLSYIKVQRAVRDDRYKLIRYPNVNVTQLFDLQNDPDEMHNLAADPAQQERVTAMLTRLKSLQANYNDDLPLEVANPQPAAWTPPTDEPPPTAKPGKAAKAKQKK